MADSRVRLGIPNLFNGISQQAPNLRLKSQGTNQINLYPSLVRGLEKRPPTTHIAKLMDGVGAADAKRAVHFIDRGDGEEYIAVFGHKELNVFNNISGVAYKVYAPSGLDYLTVATTARETIRANSLADYTIVINNTVTCLMDTTESLAVEPINTAYIWIKRGNYTCTYAVSIGGTTYSYTTADPGATSATFVATESIAAGLVAAIGALAGYTITQNGSLIKIVKASGSFTFGVADSFSSSAMVGLKVNIGKKEDLPDVGESGMWFRVTGNSKDAEDDYYVRYNDNSGAYKGIWEEYRGWSQYNIFKPSTMPHTLIRYFVTGTEAGALGVWIAAQGLVAGNIYFAFDVADWEDRLVGDNDTAAIPEFIGNKISDVFFHGTRLGFLSGEWWYMSRISDFFNFWPKTVQQVLDDGPIALSSGQISGLHSALPWNKALLAFSDRNQLQITSAGALTPESARADIVTSFASSKASHPVASGPNVYFSADRDPYSVIREYYVMDDGVSNDATNITGHVPELIPYGIFSMAASSNEDILLVMTTGQRDTLYVYKYYWSGREKLQSSWGKYVFTGGTILGAGFFGGNVSLVIMREGNIYLERFPIQIYSNDSGLTYLSRLDRKCTVTGVYNAGTGITTFTLPYVESVSTALTIVLGSAFTTRKGAPITTGLRPTTGTITLAGDLSAGAVFIGKPYTARYTFSPFYVREPNEAETAIMVGEFLVKEVLVTYDSSGDFAFEVETPGRPTSTQTQSGILGAPLYIIGQVFITSGVASCEVQEKNVDCTVHLVNDGPFPSRWLNAEVVGTYDSLQRSV